MEFGNIFFRIMGICAFASGALQSISWVLSKFFTYPLNINEHASMMSDPYYPAQMYVIVLGLFFHLASLLGNDNKKDEYSCLNRYYSIHINNNLVAS